MKKYYTNIKFNESKINHTKRLENLKKMPAKGDFDVGDTVGNDVQGFDFKVLKVSGNWALVIDVNTKKKQKIHKDSLRKLSEFKEASNVTGKILWTSVKHGNGIIVDGKGNEYYFDSSTVKDFSNLKRKMDVSFTPAKLKPDNILVARDIQIESKNINHTKRLENLKKISNLFEGYSVSEGIDAIGDELDKRLSKLSSLKPLIKKEDSARALIYKIALPEIEHSNSRIKNLTLVKFILDKINNDFYMWATSEFLSDSSSVDGMVKKIMGFKGGDESNVDKGVSMAGAYLKKIKQSLSKLKVDDKYAKNISIKR
jgi:hypothetical protein